MNLLWKAVAWSNNKTPSWTCHWWTWRPCLMLLGTGSVRWPCVYACSTLFRVSRLQRLCCFQSLRKPFQACLHCTSLGSGILQDKTADGTTGPFYCWKWRAHSSCMASRCWLQWLQRHGPCGRRSHWESFGSFLCALVSDPLKTRWRRWTLPKVRWDSVKANAIETSWTSWLIWPLEWRGLLHMTVGLKKRLILAQVCKQNKSGLDRVIILSERQAAGLCRAVFHQFWTWSFARRLRDCWPTPQFEAPYHDAATIGFKVAWIRQFKMGKIILKSAGCMNTFHISLIWNTCFRFRFVQLISYYFLASFLPSFLPSVTYWLTDQTDLSLFEKRSSQTGLHSWENCCHLRCVGSWSLTSLLGEGLGIQAVANQSRHKKFGTLAFRMNVKMIFSAERRQMFSSEWLLCSCFSTAVVTIYLLSLSKIKRLRSPTLSGAGTPAVTLAATEWITTISKFCHRR